MTADTQPIDDGRSSGSRIAVIDKAVRTLDALMPVPEGLTPTEVAEAIGTNRSTAFRLLTSLELAGLVARDKSTSRYQLGMKLLQYGSAVRSGLNIIRLAEPILSDLRDQTRQSVFLAVREGFGARCLFRLPGPEVDVLSWSTGEWLPMHLGAAPQALMAAMNTIELDHYLDRNDDRRNRGGDRTRDEVLAEIQEIRSRGWSLDRAGITQGVASLGTVVRDSSSTIAGAISVAGLEHHYDGLELNRTASAVVTAAREIGNRLP